MRKDETRERSCARRAHQRGRITPPWPPRTRTRPTGKVRRGPSSLPGTASRERAPSISRRPHRPRLQARQPLTTARRHATSSSGAMASPSIVPRRPGPRSNAIGARSSTHWLANRPTFLTPGFGSQSRAPHHHRHHLRCRHLHRRRPLRLYVFWLSIHGTTGIMLQ